MLNKYRHQMLGKALERCELEGAVEGIGYAACFKEEIWVYQTEFLNSEEWDMLGTLAIAFDQDYFLYIENDVCYQVDPLSLNRTHLGIWWRATVNTPTPVMDAIGDGMLEKAEGAYTYYGADYYGLHKDEDIGEAYQSYLNGEPYPLCGNWRGSGEDLAKAGEELEAELDGTDVAAGPYMEGTKIEKDASTARNIKY
jgi:hypothetical protein